MHNRFCRISIVAVMLVTLVSSALLFPAVSVAATPKALTTATSNNTKSNSGLIDILIGLLLGKFFGNIINNDKADANVINNNTTTAKQRPATPTAIINTAKSFLGTPYVWGGTTPNGFDCSGFTQYVLKQHGINIPRTAAEQYNAGKPILKSALKTGDLVFFTTYKPGASHVGFYLGDGQFIHAGSGAKQVTISSLDGEYYTQRYIGARRF